MTKKLPLAAILTALIVSAGAAFGQSQQHDVEVTIPTVNFIRMTMGTSTAAVTAPESVQFNWAGAPAAYQTAVEAGGSLPTTAPTNWDDIQVLSNSDNGWSVEMSVTNVTGIFDWSQIDVTSVVGTNALPAATAAAVQVASETARTNGWQSLGIDPGAYYVNLDGTEAAGNSSATVVFTLIDP